MRFVRLVRRVHQAPKGVLKALVGFPLFVGQHLVFGGDLSVVADIITEDGDDESHADRLFATLRAWGLAEAILDMCLLAIMRRHDTRRPLPPYPATLERKLGYLAEAHRIFPTLSEGVCWAGEIDKRFAAEKTLRNIIVHATPLKHDPNGTVHFMHLERRKGGLPNYVLKVVRPRDWDRLFTISAQLTGYLALLLFVTSPPDDGLLDETEERRREREIQFAATFPGSKALRELLKQLIASRA